MPKYRVKAWCGCGHGDYEEHEETIEAPSREAAEEHARETLQDMIVNLVDAGIDVREKGEG